MCGIAGFYDYTNCMAERASDAMTHRGPDGNGIARLGCWTLAHRRLAILDVSGASAQPFRGREGSLLTYNGECWNFKALREELIKLDWTFRTTGDVEVVSAALEEWGCPEALKKMEWMGALGWTPDGEKFFVARDRFGECPLHVRGRAFASEIKALNASGARGKTIELPPGRCRELSGGVETVWYDVPTTPRELSLSEAAVNVRQLLLDGCRERSISDVPVCTLLSGGLDSSAIALGLLTCVENLTAYTAVFNEKSADLRRARDVAEFLGIELREVRVDLPTAKDLDEVVRVIEQPSKAQVEIAWACLKLARTMRADGFRVTFSGEGSDELWASYGFSFHALRTEDWHAYRKKLVLDQARKNFSRCNKVFLAHGIECRLPFLHRPLVELALSLPRDAVQKKGKPKAVLQEAFRGLLPDSVVNRAKVAFQDGMGLKDAIAERVLENPRSRYMSAWEKLYGEKLHGENSTLEMFG